MLKILEPIISISEIPIELHNITRINSIKTIYPNERQKSKIPTFALTYDGTHFTLEKNLGLSSLEAKSIESNYHKLYEVSDNWKKDKIKQASKDGYVTVAFGLRLRTPLLKQVILDTSKTPYEASSEARTAGNALGQSWCMLNSRAGSEFMDKVRNSIHSLDIKPCAQIHDAGYYLIKDDITTLMFTNKHLVKAISWQEDPAIQNVHVKMSGKLDIFWPHWGSPISIPNEITESKIYNIIKIFKQNQKEKGKK